MEPIKHEALQQTAKYAQRPTQVDREFCTQAFAYALEKIDANLITFASCFPTPASQKLQYAGIDNVEWTSAFWTGMLWLAYEWTGLSKYRIAAETHLASYQKRLTQPVYTHTHDLGFLYTLSCVAQFKLTGNPTARRTALQAADLLTGRYLKPAGIIQAWGDLDDLEQRGRMIVDCGMNLPLLYWATLTTGETRYGQIAVQHASQAAKYLVRPDASTYHTFYMDAKTGEPRFGKTAQGYSDTSCWSRGQAWGIYGFALSFGYTGQRSLLEVARKLANYFLNRLPQDDICYWDLCFTEGPEERDSSAAAIAACGLLELAKQLPLSEPERYYYENAALRMIASLTKNYTTRGVASNGILQHGVYGKPWHEGVDECTIWGDYFYLEALIRVMQAWSKYW